MGVLQTGEIFCQAPSTFYLGKKLQVHVVLSGENEEVRK